VSATTLESIYINLGNTLNTNIFPNNQNILVNDNQNQNLEGKLMKEKKEDEIEFKKELMNTNIHNDEVKQDKSIKNIENFESNLLISKN